LPFLVLLLATLGAILLAIVHASFFEWCFHRYWLHRPWLPKDVFTAHTLVHHQLCKFDDTFEVTEEEQHEALHFQWWGGPFLILINMLPWAGIIWTLERIGLDLPATAIMIAGSSTFALYYAGYEGFHYLMHKPSIPFIETRGFFQFLKRHHRIHHVHMDRNLNVLVPFADWVLGTLVLEAAVPAVTPESARRLARRHSRSAARSDRTSA
jgi:hypothetical protein